MTATTRPNSKFAPMNPDPESDIGTHYFTYSLYPHEGIWKEANTIGRGLELNNPLLPLFPETGDGALSYEYSFLEIDAENVTLETMKKAGVGDDLIIRVAERHNRRTNATPHLFKEIVHACESDLLENRIGEATWKDHTISIILNPCEIKTMRLRFR